MSTDDTTDEAAELLQQLGLNEYEARCFVGLSRLSTGTARRLSEITDVPRTRVYDSIRVLETHGLVEIQHSSPQQFHAVPLEEAMETLRDQYESRVERLADALEATETAHAGTDEVQEVWAMTGADAIGNRTRQLLGDATDEAVLVVGEESILTEELIEALNAAGEGPDLLVGAVTEPLRERIRDTVPDAETFVSGLDWLQSERAGDEAAIGRLLLVDRSTILVSTILPGTREEHAVFGGGFGNGLVVIARRLMAQEVIGNASPGGSGRTR